MFHVQETRDQRRVLATSGDVSASESFVDSQDGSSSNETYSEEGQLRTGAAVYWNNWAMVGDISCHEAPEMTSGTQVPCAP